MDKTEVSSCGFGRRPERRIRSSNDHHSRLKMIKYVRNKSWLKINMERNTKLKYTLSVYYLSTIYLQLLYIHIIK